MAVTFNTAGTSLTNNSLGSIAAGAGAISSLAGLLFATPSISGTQGYQPTQSIGTTSLTTALASVNFSSAIGNFIQSLPPSLVFNYEGENAITIESDITDHYVENNSAIQDQIGLKPEIITAKGYIGELNDIFPAFLQPLQTIATAFTTISAYTPKLSQTAITDYDEALLAYEQAASIAQSSISTVGSLGGAAGLFQGAQIGGNNTGVFQSGSSLSQNKQQAMFTQFYGYWVNRILFNVQTPWAVFTNMAIQNIKVIQSPETRVISDFEVTFKKIRTAQTSTSITPTALAARAAAQNSNAAQLGTSSGAPLASGAPYDFGSNLTSAVG